MKQWSLKFLEMATIQMSNDAKRKFLELDMSIDAMIIRNIRGW